MASTDKPMVWLHGEVKTPPFSAAARLEVGVLLRRLQRGERVSMPHSRPLASLGRRCHELRIRDAGATWRLVYRVDADAIVIAEVFSKRRRPRCGRCWRSVSGACAPTIRQRAIRSDDGQGKAEAA